MSSFSSISSSRWTPTPEQLMILEEMYRSGGVRTPNASQIQQITAHLSLYGKIEGKNVFYWFQNHKARDRQRLRRRLAKLQLYHNIKMHHHHQDHDHQCFNGLDRPTTSMHLNPIGVLQPSGMVHNPSTTMKNRSQTWNLNNIPEIRCQSDDDSMMKSSNGHDWMKILNVGPSTVKKPLETLDLFPITTSSGLKEDRTSPEYFSNPSIFN